MKYCPKCKKDKPRTPEYFYRSSQTIDGLQGHCKVCRSLSHKEYTKNEIVKQKIRDSIKKYFKTPKGKLVRKKSDAKRWIKKKRYIYTGVTTTCNSLEEALKSLEARKLDLSTIKNKSY